MQKSPEAIVADMLGLEEHMIGNVSLSTDTNSMLFDENFDPKFVKGRIDRRIQFDVVSKDRNKIEPLTDALEGRKLVGSLAITAITGDYVVDYVVDYGYWRLRIDGHLLRGPETAELFNSFGRL